MRPDRADQFVAHFGQDVFDEIMEALRSQGDISRVKLIDQEQISIRGPISEEKWISRGVFHHNGADYRFEIESRDRDNSVTNLAVSPVTPIWRRGGFVLFPGDSQ